MALFDVLSHFGFDFTWRSRMVRHQDTRKGIDFKGMFETDRFEDYQEWQRRPVFKDADYVVSFIGAGGGKARFWGVYKVLGSKLIAADQLPQEGLWYWHPNTPHYRYKLERLPAFDVLSNTLVMRWSNERTWVQHLKDNEVLECPPLQDIDIPIWSPEFAEGMAFTKLVMSRKRSQEARAECIKFHGCRCAVCEMTFPDVYEGLGDGFMHVHHNTAMASQSGEYKVDPKKDLRPVCPNCHSMLHWGTVTPRTIEELRAAMGKSASPPLLLS